ncbi:DNA-binding transcriptional regulator CsiR [Neptuniibacter halophilus]|uniref:DNA-binding transcriptional regulator CsiR n=1 Tax=Neptuniibacter halophilus TaxID=651666 RepID=UPI002572A5A9|nr:DNA-binding transcriptional regulator CsiR [Neptuniibacter halophilus]
MTAQTRLNPAQSSDNFAAQVLGQLKQDILSGYFNPGEKLKMARLKERYQVGVGPLREALSQLLVEQLVVVENQRGFTVHPISAEELEDIYQTRAEIEALCISQAIDKGDDAWEAGILAAAHQLNKSSHLLEQDNPQNIQQWEALHQAFHKAIAAGCQSPTLLHVRRSLYEKASRYRNYWLKENMLDKVVFDANQKEHQTLTDALLARDKATAVALIRQHILSPYRLLKDSIRF